MSAGRQSAITMVNEGTDMMHAKKFCQSDNNTGIPRKNRESCEYEIEKNGREYKDRYFGIALDRLIRQLIFEGD